MRLSRNRLIGYIVVCIGAMIFLSVIGLGILIGPLIFAAVGVYFLKKDHKWIGYICLILAGFMLFERVFAAIFRIHIGGVLVAALFIYFGYRMIKGKKRSDLDEKQDRKDEKYQRKRNKKNHRHRVKENKRRSKHESQEFDPSDDWLDEEIENLKQEQKVKEKQDKAQSEKTNTSSTYHDDPDIIITTPEFRGSIIGDLRLTNHRFELRDMNLSYGIGDNKIDLSKAIIPEGESTIVISGLIGDVDIYVPYDLEIAVSASVTIGSLEVLGYKQGGLNRQINLSTKGYSQATRKVKISVSIFIGDVDVRFI